MNPADLFVGGITAMLGLSAMLSALLNWETAFRLPKAKALELRLGRAGARAVLGVLGMLLLGLGVSILLGFRLFAQTESGKPTRTVVLNSAMAL